MTIRQNPSETLARFRRDGAGSMMPIMAMSLMAIVSLGGAALALSLDGRAANNIQSTADFAALSGASAFVSANSPRLQDRVTDARSAVEASVFANASYEVRDLKISSIVEDPYGQHARIEVSLAFQPANPAAKMAGRNAGIEIERSATASATWGFPLCILGLDGQGTGLAVRDNANLTANNCVVWTNATSGLSMQLSGGTAQAKHFCAAGRATSTGAKVTPQPHEDCDPVPDPLASWAAPAAGPLRSSGAYAIDGLDSFLTMIAGVLKGIVDKSIVEGYAQTTQDAVTQMEDILVGSPVKLLDADRRFIWGPAKGLNLAELLQIAGSIDNLDPSAYENDSHANLPTIVFSPGTYNGLNIDKGHARFEPGVYHIVNNPLVVRRRAILTGEGVTIVLVGDRATFSVLDEARLTLTAPEDGPTAGFALAEDRRQTLKKPDMLRSRLTGSGRVNMIGTLYLPRQQLSIIGKGAAEQTSPLLQIVADNLEMADEGALKIEFNPSATRVPVTIKAAREARLEN